MTLGISDQVDNLDEFFAEPILIMDKAECVTWENGWTTVTADGSWAAQFEHTVLVTRTGVEILTKH